MAPRGNNNSGTGKYYYVKECDKGETKCFVVFPASKHYDLHQTTTRVRYKTFKDACIVAKELNNNTCMSDCSKCQK